MINYIKIYLQIRICMSNVVKDKLLLFWYIFYMTIIEERALKADKIIEEYAKRKTQDEVADLFGMTTEHVSKVTQKCDFRHTRKITEENIRPGECISPIIDYEKLNFLDKYPMQNFQ